MSWKGRLAPGVPDLVFGLVLLTVLVGGRTRLLNDPGTFWHLRLGREIVRTGDVPRVDTLTYTRSQTPWVDQSWAFDLALAAVVDHAGWSAAIGLTALGLAALYGALARSLMRDGVSPIIAAVVTVLAVGISAIHFLIRPHLFTMFFVYLVLRLCQRQHERGGWAVAPIPLLMIVWANVHGGFLAGPLIVFTAAAGHAVSGPWDEARKRNLGKFAAIFGLSVVAPLVNPYGPGLYRHVYELLGSSGLTQLIEEYQPIPFGQAEFRVVEWILLGLIALPTFSSRRLDRYELAHTLVWLHFALGSQRHAPLFALAMAPGLARVLDGLPLESRELGRSRVRWTAWPLATAAVVVLAVAAGVRLGGFDPQTWPLGAVATLDQQPLEARLFHEQDWGGMIEAECRPTRKTFVDDRFELFGKTAILQYVDALKGGPDWDSLAQRERIDLVWVRPYRGLARRLAADPGWQVLHRDEVSVLFRRKPQGRSARTQRAPGDRLAPALSRPPAVPTPGTAMASAPAG